MSKYTEHGVETVSVEECNRGGGYGLSSGGFADEPADAPEHVPDGEAFQWYADADAARQAEAVAHVAAAAQHVRDMSNSTLIELLALADELGEVGAVEVASAEVLRRLGELSDAA